MPEGELPPFPDGVELPELPMLPEFPILPELLLPLHESEIISTLVTLNVFPDELALPEDADDIPLSHVPFTATSCPT